MGVYLLIFGVLAALSYKELFGTYSDKSKRYTLICVSIVYVILSSIYRGPMGDFYVYEEEFLKTDFSPLTNISDNHFEYLYEVLSVLVRTFTSSYAVFRMIVAIIVMVLWYKIYTYKPFNGFSKYILTMLLVVWALSYGNIFIVRSTIAISICLYSCKFIYSKKPLSFILCFIFAVGFHTMSIIWLPAYFIYNNKNMRKYLYVTIFFALLLSPFLPNIIAEVSKIFGPTIHQRIVGYISYGLDNTFGMAPNRFYTLIKAMANMLLLVVVFQLAINANKHNFRTMRRGTQQVVLVQAYAYNRAFNLYLFGVLLYIISLFTSLALSRAALPYTALQYVLIPQIFNVAKFKRKLDKQIFFGIFIAYLLVRMISNLMGSAYIPFMNYEVIV